MSDHLLAAADPTSPSSSQVMSQSSGASARRSASPRSGSSFSREADGESLAGTTAGVAIAVGPSFVPSYVHPFEPGIAASPLSVTPSIRRFSCRQCQPVSSFPTERARDNHKRKMHVHSVAIPVPGGQTYRVHRGSNGVFECPTCERSIADAATFAAHVKSTKSCSVIHHWPVPTGLPANWTLLSGPSTASALEGDIAPAAIAVSPPNAPLPAPHLAGIQDGFGPRSPSAGRASFGSSDAVSSSSSPTASSPASTYERSTSDRPLAQLDGLVHLIEIAAGRSAGLASGDSYDGRTALLALVKMLEPLLSLPPAHRLSRGSNAEAEALASVVSLSRLIAPSAALLVEAASSRQSACRSGSAVAAARSEPADGSGPMDVDGLSAEGTAGLRRLMSEAAQVEVAGEAALTTD